MEVSKVKRNMPKDVDKTGDYVFYECSGCRTVNDWNALRCQGCKLTFDGIVVDGTSFGSGSNDRLGEVHNP